MPSGSGKTSYVDVRDVALATATILENPNLHIGKSYSITGKEAISHSEIASIFSSVLQQETHHIDPTIEDYKKALESYQVPNFIYDFMAMLYTEVKENKWNSVSDDFKNITGQSQKTFESFVEENKKVFTR